MHPTQNSLSENVRKSVIDVLQARLFDSIDLASQMKQAHWAVRGPNFIALHGLFDTVHGNVNGHTDLLAERITALGGRVEGTARSAAANSSLSEYPLDAVAGDDHVAAVSTALARFGASIRADIDAAADAGDQGSADLFTEISRAVDQDLWLVEAHKG